MKKMFIILVLLVIGISMANSQSRSNYIELRDAGKVCMQKGQFADAKFIFDGAEGFASELSEAYVKEIQNLQRTLRDSVNTVYNAAYNLMGRNDEKAVMMFERLFDKSGKPMHANLYAQMGWSYGQLKMKEKQRKLYEKGLAEGESLAAYYLAVLMQENRDNVSTDSLLNLYLSARYVKSSIDSVAIIYYRKAQYNKSYSMFSKNQTVFSKYWRARILLDDKTNKYLDDAYKSDDPIKFLSEAACADNLSSAKSENRDALFYLGMLYRYAKPGDRVKRDEIKGRSLIIKAKDLGHPEAKRIWYNL